ncbi:MAG: hypothetical protein RBS39_02380 [Phycisphaerales bacterium]|jgi:SAM-dependent methyltransferase|nr:hypothetical protein [Phycisphaerales bacterium]
MSPSHTLRSRHTRGTPRHHALACAAALVLAVAPLAWAQQDAPSGTPASIDPALESLRTEAVALAPIVKSPAVRELLDAVPSLPGVEATTIYYRRGVTPREVYSQEAYDALPEETRAELSPIQISTARYYVTFYGSPLASMRLFDLAAQASHLQTFNGLRVLDYGFGSIGQLELLAMCGANVVGIEVEPILQKFYEPRGLNRDVTGPNHTGHLRMLFAQWPGPHGEVSLDAGHDLDLFVSKNTLKRGYVRPREEAPAGSTIDLGVSPEAFLAAVHDALKPGGMLVIYNIGGAPPAEGEPYSPMTDIASPWTRAEYESAGFEVLTFDADDSAAIRDCARALGWEQPPYSMDLEHDLFARCTIARRSAG